MISGNRIITCYVPITTVANDYLQSKFDENTINKYT